jgi:hypothetical protein
VDVVEGMIIPDNSNAPMSQCRPCGRLAPR